jgi:hypothetical protein
MSERRRSAATVQAARVVAAVMGVATGVNIVTSGMAARPASSLFLVPDLLVVVLLLTGAALPATRAAPVLLVALGTAVGVFTTAAMSYALRGATGWGVLAFAVVAAGTATALTVGSAPRHARPRARDPHRPPRVAG